MAWHLLCLRLLLFASYQKKLFFYYYYYCKISNLERQRRKNPGMRHCASLICWLRWISQQPSAHTRGQNRKASVQEEAHMCCTVPFMETATGRKINFRFGAASQYADLKIKLTASRSDLEARYVNCCSTKNITRKLACKSRLPPHCTTWTLLCVLSKDVFLSQKVKTVFKYFLVLCTFPTFAFLPSTH